MKKRVDYIDLFRGIVILLVIYGHSGCVKFPQAIAYYQSFYMSSFFLFSGFFHKETKSFFLQLKKSFRRTYIPYVLWLLLIMSFFSIIDMSNHAFEISKYLIILREGLLGIAHPNYVGQYWFLIAFFTLQVGFSALDKFVNNSHLKAGFVCILAFLGICINHIGIRHTLFRIDTALMVLPIFYCGILLKKYWGRLLELKRNELFILAVIHFVAVYLNYFLSNCSPVSLWAEVYNNYLLFYIGAILGTVVWMNILKRINETKNNHLAKILNWVKFIGENSIVPLLNMNLVIYIFRSQIFARIPVLNQHSILINHITCLLTMLVQVFIIKILNEDKLKFLIGK